jgi:hypothetical protein
VDLSSPEPKQGGTRRESKVVSLDDEKTSTLQDLRRYLIARVRENPKLGNNPEQFDSQLRWLLTQEVVGSYLRLGPKVKVDTSYDPNNPNGRTLSGDRELLSYWLENAYNYLFGTQLDQVTRVYESLIARPGYQRFSPLQRAGLLVIYEQSLEQGPCVVLADTFLANRINIAQSTAIAPSHAGKLVNRLAVLGYLEIVSPGVASWVVHERRSRIVRLWGNW